jgi:CheY-like chemotaxis protein
MKTMGSTIFVIDSSPAVRRMVEQLSTPRGYSVVGFPDGPSALEAARKASPALILADVHLENMTFSGFCKEIGRQDHLAETLIVSIVGDSDRLDESKLRALGVHAFLKKPFQSEQLLETITGILASPGGKSKSGTPPKSRTWPPVSTSTDDESDGLSRSAIDDNSANDEIEKEQSAMPPSHAHTAGSSASRSAAPETDGEAMMKELFDHVSRSAALHAERNIQALLPPTITREVAGQVNVAVRAAVQAEVTRQLADALAPERLHIAMRDLIQEELRRQTPDHLASVETAVRQAVADLAPAILQQSAEKQLSSLTETEVKKQLPEALPAHMGMIDQLVKQEVERVAMDRARQAADDIIHEMARDPIQQAVQRIVPEIADTQVRAEIKRLSSAE